MRRLIMIPGILDVTAALGGKAILADAVADAHSALLARIGQEISERLRAAAENVLGRAHDVRRGHVS